MVTLFPLRSRSEDIKKLGELCHINAPARHKAVLVGNFIVAGAGAFSRRLRVPLYSLSELDPLDEAQLGFVKAESSCIGFAAAVKGQPAGYFTASAGPYTYIIPLWDGGRFSPYGWRIAGYLPADTGYIAVLKRRTLFWILLPAAALLAGAVSYFGFRFGWSELFPRIRELFSGLFS